MTYGRSRSDQLESFAKSLTTDGQKGIESNITFADDLNGCAVDSLIINSYSSGITSGNDNVVSYRHYEGDANDTGGQFTEYLASYNPNGGTMARSTAFGNTPYFSQLIRAYSGEINFIDYDSYIRPTRFLDGDGNALTIQSGDGLDSGATARNGANLNLKAGVGVNSGTDGYIDFQSIAKGTKLSLSSFPLDMTNYLLRVHTNNSGYGTVSGTTFMPASSSVSGTYGQSLTLSANTIISAIAIPAFLSQIGKTITVYEGEGFGGTVLDTTSFTVDAGPAGGAGGNLYVAVLNSRIYRASGSVITFKVTSATSWRTGSGYAGGQPYDSGGTPTGGNDFNFQIYEDTGFELCFDSANRRIGFGTSSPSVAFDFVGNMQVSTLGLANGIVLANSNGLLSSATALPNGTTATTQTYGDNTTKVATTAFVQSAVTVENLWDRVTGTPNYLMPSTSADDIGATAARITKGWFANLETTNYPSVNGTALTNQYLSDTNNVVFARVKLLDNNKLLLGTGDNASIKYDGTDLLVDPQEVGTGNLKVTTLNVANGILQSSATGVVTSSVDLPNGTTATTQTLGDNTTKLSTTAFVQSAIAAPATTAVWGNITGTLSSQTDLNNALTGKMTRTPVTAPASSSDTGTQGDWSVSGVYFYLCYATNSWIRIAGATSF